MTQGGTVLLADQFNKKIKFVSPGGSISYLQIPVYLNSNTVLDKTTAVMTELDNKLYILDITDPTAPSMIRECQLEYRILAMTNYKGNLAVICFTGTAIWIKMITTKGEEVWSVGEEESGKNLFLNPRGITATSVNDKAAIVVTDCWKDTLTLLEAETSKFIRAVHVGQGNAPVGITVDNYGNVYVCYNYTRAICGELPWSIVYNGVNDSLYVSYGHVSDKRNTVDCFKLS